MMTTADLIAAAESDAAAVPAAESAIDAARLAAELAVFPWELAPVTKDALEQYRDIIGRYSARSYLTDMARAHERSMVANPALASLLRSHEALEDIAAAAVATSLERDERTPIAVTHARVANQARCDYMRAVAGQIATRDDHDLYDAATALLSVYALKDRLGAAKAKHAEAARFERERPERERLERERQAEAARLERKRDLDRQAAEAAARIARAARIAKADEARLAYEAAKEHAALVERDYHASRCDALADRLELSGLAKIRVGRELHGAGEVCAMLREHTIAFDKLDGLEAAIGAAP